MPIRRNVEYIIRCDNENCEGDWHAFNSPTRTDCEHAAERTGWLRWKKRKWLCPNCAFVIRGRNTTHEERIKLLTKMG